MKELSIKGKAKAYDEALEMAKKLIENEETSVPVFYVNNIKDIFPELKESIDERIKKVIKQVLSESTTEKDECYLDNGVTQQEVFAWLEKQGEQPKKHDVCDNCDQQGCCVSPCPMKLVEKQGEQEEVKPKFKVGQTIKKEGFNDGFTIEKIEDGFYYNAVGDHFSVLAQDQWELVEQKPAEWSEEDYNEIKTIACHLDNIGNEAMAKSLLNIMDKYKSCRPQNHWKPSEDLPHWKKIKIPNHYATGFNSEQFTYKGYYINYVELFNRLPKED